MKRTMILVLGLIILQGCSEFQLSSTRKKVIVDKISPDTVTVTFCGNAYMTQKEVEKYTLQRASIEALSKGCSHFMIVKKDDRSRFCSLSSGMNKKNAYDAPPVKDSDNLTPSEFVEPNVTLTIRCVSKNETIPVDAIDAEKFLADNFPGMNK